jgi:hypothetical protein
MPAWIETVGYYRSLRQGETEYHLGGGSRHGWICPAGRRIELANAAEWKEGDGGTLCEDCRDQRSEHPVEVPQLAKEVLATVEDIRSKHRGSPAGA